MIELETSEALFRAFVDSYHAVYRHRPPQNACDTQDRCVYDPACPFYADCELTDYTE